MAKNKELSTRQREGLVEENFKQKPRDETVEAGEHLSDDSEYTGDVILSEPSMLASPYMSVEEQGMELRTEVVGPPAYGSPEPTTSASKLLPLRDHPLRAEALPADHPARISDDYGASNAGDTVMPGESSHPATAQLSDLENDLLGRKDMREGNYEEMNKTELKAEADRRGLEVASDAKKADLVEALKQNDAENADDDDSTE